MTPTPETRAPASDEAAGRPATATADRLMDAAERLFAEQGIEPVSIRAINAAAGANVAAVHYHFGSKVDLVDAVLRRRLGTIADRRLELLGRLGPEPAVRDVAGAVVQPLVEMGREPDSAGRVYVRFLAALHNTPGAIDDVFAETFASQGPPLYAAYERAAPWLTTELRGFRLQLAGRVATDTVATLEKAATRLGLQPGEEAVVEHLVDAVTGILGAPVSGVDGQPAGRSDA